jgi:hypothetical protein
MNGCADVGERALAGLRECLGIEAAAPSESRHGFAWNPFGWVQRAWAAPALARGEDPGRSVHLRTELSLRLDGAPASIEALRSRLPLATLSGVVRNADDPCRVQLASSLFVHSGNEGWAVRLLTAAARLQLLEAFLLDRLASTPPPGARLPGPGFGLGLDRATETSAETGPDVAECAAALRGLPGARAVRTPSGLSASLPFGERAEKGLLELVAQARRPALGPGLSVVLALPGDGGVLEAIELNEGEIGERSDTDLLGGWSARAGGRVFTTFLPMAAWDRGLAVEIVLGFVRRVRRLASGPTSSPS